jgi:hypothetical protein
MFGEGLERCTSAAEVLGSSWIAHLAAVNSLHPLRLPTSFSDLRHRNLLFNPTTVECVGTSLTVSREAAISFPDLTSGP